MDLSSPLRSLVPSLDSAVLEVLAGTESGLSATHIARLSDRGTRAGQAPVLSRLVDHGLVVADPANTGYLYRLNRDHVLAPAVLAATTARAEVIHRLTGTVAAIVPTPVHASLFGSFARGEANETSDVDLLLVTPDEVDTHSPAWLEQTQRLEDQVVTWTGNRLEPLVFTASHFRDVVESEAPIVGSWRAEAITIHGDDLSRVLSAVA